VNAARFKAEYSVFLHAASYGRDNGDVIGDGFRFRESGGETDRNRLGPLSAAKGLRF